MGPHAVKRIAAIFSFLFLFVFRFTFPPPASAEPILKLDFKILPDLLVQGTQVDIPLYLVENRGASDQSLFSGPYPPPPQAPVYPGPFPLAAVYSTLESSQSRFISFTTIDGFDAIHTISIHDHSMSMSLKSTAGIPVTVDNSGISGRTEILLGMVRMEVGAPIPQDDGFGGPDPALIFRADFAADPSTGQNAARYFDAGVYQTLGGILSTTYQVTEAQLSSPTPTATPTPATPDDPGNFTLFTEPSYTPSSGTIYPQFKCNGLPGAICNGKAKLFVSKKVGGKVEKTSYGKCTLPEATAPNMTYCTLKINAAAKSVLKRKKNLKAKLSLSSTGVKKPIISTVTVNTQGT